MRCDHALRYLDPYLDGELEATPAAEIEQHLEGCADCAGALDLARLLKQGLRQQLRHGAPEGLDRRIADALEEERAASEETGGWQVRRSMVGFAVAAAALLTFIGYSSYSVVPRAAEPGLSQAGIASFPAQIFSDVVDRHVGQLPTEIETDVPERATSWFRGKLGFRVRSVQFDQPNVRFVGARVSNVGAHQAAELYYNVGDSRLTLIVFRPPASMQKAISGEGDLSSAPGGMSRKRIGQRTVAYRTVRGYTVPVFQHEDVVYAITGDLDRAQLLHLAASVRLP